MKTGDLIRFRVSSHPVLALVLDEDRRILGVLNGAHFGIPMLFSSFDEIGDYENYGPDWVISKIENNGTSIERGRLSCFIGEGEYLLRFCSLSAEFCYFNRLTRSVIVPSTQLLIPVENWAIWRSIQHFFDQRDTPEVAFRTEAPIE